MRFFGKFANAPAKEQPDGDAVAERPAEQLPLDLGGTGDIKRGKRRTGHTEIYSVRVRENFKGEMLALQAELQRANPSKFRCVVCKEAFVAGRSDAKTCSPRCRMALHRHNK